MVISRTIDKFAKDHSCVIAISPEHGGRWLSTINDSTNLIQPQMTNTKVVLTELEKTVNKYTSDLHYYTFIIECKLNNLNDLPNNTFIPIVASDDITTGTSTWQFGIIKDNGVPYLQYKLYHTNQAEIKNGMDSLAQWVSDNELLIHIEVRAQTSRVMTLQLLVNEEILNTYLWTTVDFNEDYLPLQINESSYFQTPYVTNLYINVVNDKNVSIYTGVPIEQTTGLLVQSPIGCINTIDNHFEVVKFEAVPSSITLGYDPVGSNLPHTIICKCYIPKAEYQSGTKYQFFGTGNADNSGVVGVVFEKNDGNYIFQVTICYLTDTNVLNSYTIPLPGDYRSESDFPFDRWVVVGVDFNISETSVFNVYFNGIHYNTTSLTTVSTTIPDMSSFNRSTRFNILAKGAATVHGPSVLVGECLCYNKRLANDEHLSIARVLLGTDYYKPYNLLLERIDNKINIQFDTSASMCEIEYCHDGQYYHPYKEYVHTTNSHVSLEYTDSDSSPYIYVRVRAISHEYVPISGWTYFSPTQHELDKKVYIKDKFYDTCRLGYGDFSEIWINQNINDKTIGTAYNSQDEISSIYGTLSTYTEVLEFDKMLQDSNSKFRIPTMWDMDTFIMRIGGDQFVTGGCSIISKGTLSSGGLWQDIPDLVDNNIYKDYVPAVYEVKQKQDYLFNLLPGGFCDEDGIYKNLSYTARFWIISPSEGDYHTSIELYNYVLNTTVSIPINNLGQDVNGRFSVTIHVSSVYVPEDVRYAGVGWVSATNDVSDDAIPISIASAATDSTNYPNVVYSNAYSEIALHSDKYMHVRVGPAKMNLARLVSNNTRSSVRCIRSFEYGFDPIDNNSFPVVVIGDWKWSTNITNTIGLNYPTVELDSIYGKLYTENMCIELDALFEKYGSKYRIPRIDEWIAFTEALQLSNASHIRSSGILASATGLWDISEELVGDNFTRFGLLPNGTGIVDNGSITTTTTDGTNGSFLFLQYDTELRTGTISLTNTSDDIITDYNTLSNRAYGIRLVERFRDIALPFGTMRFVRVGNLWVSTRNLNYGGINSVLGVYYPNLIPSARHIHGKLYTYTETEQVITELNNYGCPVRLLTPTDVSQLINYDNNSESTIGSKICDINTWLVNLYSPNFCNNVYEISATASGEYTDKVFTGMGTSASIWLSRDLLLDEQHQYLSIVSEHIQEDNRSINCAIERMLLSNDVRKSIRLVYDPSVLV